MDRDPHDGLTVIAAAVALGAGAGWLIVSIIKTAAQAAHLTGVFQ